MDIKKELKALERLAKKAADANALYNQQRNRIAENCPHPIEYIKQYNWEHDSGYGVQTRMLGNECSICLMVDPYKSGNFHKRW
jgi:hypothetical protein